MPRPTPKEIREQLDPICDAFEARWLQGERPSINDLVQASPPQIQSQLFSELLGIELELRGRNGERLVPEEYEASFPDYRAEIQSTFQEHQTRVQEANQRRKVVRFIDPAAETAQIDASAYSDSGSSDASGDLAKNPAPEPPALIGRYKVLRPLGRGGMGEVFLAEHTILQRQVAIKLPVFSEHNREQLIARFYREARAMAKVEHPNLCRIHEVGEIDGRPFLAMAYIDGETLAQKLRSGQSMTADEAVAIVHKLATAMAAAHEAKVVHRDLKPGNVMIDKKGVPWITDFGLVKSQEPIDDELSTAGTIVGTPAYMAPEQVMGDGNTIGPVTDVYAIGVILYELLTGRRPFPGKGMAVMGQIASGNPPAAPSSFAKVDKKLESICLKAMAFDPAARFQSAEELARALEAWQRSGKPSERTSLRPKLLQAGVVAATALALFAVYYLIIQGIGSGGQAPSDKVSKVPPDDSQKIDPVISIGTGTVWASPVNLSELNGPEVDGSPTFSGDGSVVVFHRPNGGPFHLWIAARLPDGSGYGSPELLGPEVNSPETSTNPRLTSDGLTLVFDSDRPGGEGGMDLWFSTRESLESPWSDARNFGPNVNSGGWDVTPFLSDDRLTLVFASNRAGGSGGDDLWIAKRASVDEDFGVPVHAGAQVNTSGSESQPWLSNDGLTLMFRSKQNEGQGGFDLWISRRNSAQDEFGPPENVGPPVNSEHQEGHGSLSMDGTVIYFESKRPGCVGEYDIWKAELAKPEKPFQ